MTGPVGTRARLALVVLVCLGVCGGARAEKRDPDATAKEREAREHYNKGILHYDLGEIDVAIQEFRAAYASSAAPGLLFNIAQAYRQKKDYEQALHFYRTYLRLQPRAMNRADVEARVAEMEKLLAEEQRLGNERPHGIIPPGGKAPQEEHHPPVPTARPAAPDSTRIEEPGTTAAPAPAPLPGAAVQASAKARHPFLRTPQGIAAVSVGAVGLVALATAAGLGAAALSARDEYRRLCATAGPSCDQGRYDQARGLALGTDVLIGIGAAAAVTSVVLALVRPRAATRAGLYAPNRAGGLVWGSF